MAHLGQICGESDKVPAPGGFMGWSLLGDLRSHGTKQGWQGLTGLDHFWGSKMVSGKTWKAWVFFRHSPILTQSMSLFQKLSQGKRRAPWLVSSCKEAKSEKQNLRNTLLPTAMQRMLSRFYVVFASARAVLASLVADDECTTGSCAFHALQKRTLERTLLSPSLPGGRSPRVETGSVDSYSRDPWFPYLFNICVVWCIYVSKNLT